MATRRLITIPISHYCEKGRWALDRAGVQYTEVPHLQGFHVAASKLAVNRGIEAGGFRNALQAGLDVCAPLYAATTEVGNRCRKMSQARCWLCAMAAIADVSPPTGIVMPAPGLKMFTSASPRKSATVVAASK